MIINNEILTQRGLPYISIAFRVTPAKLCLPPHHDFLCGPWQCTLQSSVALLLPAVSLLPNLMIPCSLRDIARIIYKVRTKIDKNFKSLIGHTHDFSEILTLLLSPERTLLLTLTLRPLLSGGQGVGIIILYLPSHGVKITHQKSLSDLWWRSQCNNLEFLIQNLPEPPFTMKKSTREDDRMIASVNLILDISFYTYNFSGFGLALCLPTEYREKAV